MSTKQENEQYYLISQSVVLALIRYLSRQPFADVEQGISALRSLQIDKEKSGTTEEDPIE